MSKNSGLVLAGLAAAGIGAYFLLGRKPAAAATGGGSGGGNASTFKVGDAVLVTGYYSNPIAGHIREVQGGGNFDVFIDDFGTDIPATIGMLTKLLG